MSTTNQKKHAVWGPNGQFPWVSNFLDTLFTSPDQLEAFLAWLSRFYRYSFELAPRAGQSVFIAGGVGVGKTFLIRAVVGGLMGGFADAVDFLMGNDSFGSELFEKGLWTIDDGCLAGDAITHKRFSEMVKKMAANHSFRFHEKFRVPMQVPWYGRIMVSCNADEESIRIIPDLDISILDKICIFKTVETRQPGFFPEPERMKAILERELPWLARWLLEYEIPAHLVGDVRFGVKSYHEPSLVQRAQQSSDTAAFTEIFEDWRETYFRDNPKVEVWEGSSFQLHKIMSVVADAAMRELNVKKLGRYLSSQSSKGDKSIQSGSKGKLRIWTIFRPESVTK